MNVIRRSRLAFSGPSSSGSMAVAFRLSDNGTLGFDTLITWLTTRDRCGSGSRHKGCEVASYIRAGISDARAAVTRPTHKDLGFDLERVHIGPLSAVLLVQRAQICPEGLRVRVESHARLLRHLGHLLSQLRAVVKQLYYHASCVGQTVKIRWLIGVSVAHLRRTGPAPGQTGPGNPRVSDAHVCRRGATGCERERTSQWPRHRTRTAIWF